MAMGAKGREPASDSIMAPADMKPLLALSKHEPVHAAIGLTADGDGVILLDKKMKSKKVLATLKASAAKAKIQLQAASLRFGKAEVDADYDPGMVRFFINKEAPGNMRVKLLEVVKKVPYQKVELNVDPSFEEESEDETDAQEAPTTTTSTAPSPPPPPPSQLDAKALTAALVQLMQAVPKVAAGDPTLQKSLVALATAAQASLKANDLPTAAGGIDALRKALAAALDQGKQKAGASPANWPAARAAWQQASDAVDSQIAVFQQQLLASGDEDYEAIAKFGLNAVTGNYKVRLMAAMREVDGGGPRDKLAKLVDEFSQHIATDERVMACDENPLKVPVSIRATLGPALQAMRAALA